MKTIEIAKQFHDILTNRNKLQGDGKHTAIEFRQAYLAELDSEIPWRESGPAVLLDFAGVEKIGPSFANEAFAYFTRFVSPEVFFEKVQFRNISRVQRLIIEEELKSGYTGQ